MLHWIVHRGVLWERPDAWEQICVRTLFEDVLLFACLLLIDGLRKSIHLLKTKVGGLVVGRCQPSERLTSVILELASARALK